MNPKDCSLQQFLAFRLPETTSEAMTKATPMALQRSEERAANSEFFTVHLVQPLEKEDLCAHILEYLTGAGYDVEVIDEPEPDPSTRGIMDELADRIGLPESERYPHMQTFKAIRDDTVMIVLVSLNDTRILVSQYPPRPYEDNG